MAASSLCSSNSLHFVYLKSGVGSPVPGSFWHVASLLNCSKPLRGPGFNLESLICRQLNIDSGYRLGWIYRLSQYSRYPYRLSWAPAKTFCIDGTRVWTARRAELTVSRKNRHFSITRTGRGALPGVILSPAWWGQVTTWQRQ